MERSLRDVALSWLATFVDVGRLVSIRHLPGFFADLRRYRLLSGVGVSSMELLPCLTERTKQTPFDSHYFFQGAWLARELAVLRPRLHVDVGSSVLTIAAISATVPTVFLDYRPLRARLSGLSSIGGDLRGLPFLSGSVGSVSSLHVVEHVGLGRYGDTLDPDGSKRALRELERIVAPGGYLFLSVPVGRSREVFNAHRIFSPETLASQLPEMSSQAFSLVDDSGRFHEVADFQSAHSLNYGCGLFKLRKRVC